MANPKFEVFQSKANNQFYYHLTASNGEKILSGEGYTSRQSCHDGIASVKINAPHDYRYMRRGATFNYTFNLVASNGEPIGRSENYTSEAGRENGIAAVKRDALGAAVVDIH
ncbi:MAG: DUF1508 domain-containing protein [Flavobacterium sp.]|nr:MAG: DUF1508 domain-containing protein [Flavobacterium sp.]